MTQTNQQAADDNFERQWFSYVLDVTVTANAVQQPSQMQILTDADFEWWFTSLFRTSSLLKVLMKEAATGRDFIGTTASVTSGAGAFNGINVDMWAGLVTSQAAFPLAVPFVMPATRTYTFLWSDTSGATNTVELALMGFKLWQKATATPAAGNANSSGAATPGVSGWR